MKNDNSESTLYVKVLSLLSVRFRFLSSTRKNLHKCSPHQTITSSPHQYHSRHPSAVRGLQIFRHLLAGRQIGQRYSCLIYHVEQRAIAGGFVKLTKYETVHARGGEPTGSVYHIQLFRRG